MHLAKRKGKQELGAPGHMHIMRSFVSYPVTCGSPLWVGGGVGFTLRIRDHILTIFNLLKRVKEVLGRRDMGVGWGGGAQAWKSQRYAR